MPSDPIVSRLRTLRVESGLSRKDLAHILDLCTAASVSRHEESDTVPNLLTAYGYEVIFRVPVSELFPGLYQIVELGIEERLTRLEEELHRSTAKGRTAASVARVLEFCSSRRTPNEDHSQR
jgi:DNA-binding XRE family transcriptional regulator